MASMEVGGWKVCFTDIYCVICFFRSVDVIKSV